VITIAYVIGSLRIGGSERQIVELVRGLDKTRYRLSICCMTERGPLAAEVEALGVAVQVFDLYLVYGKFNPLSYLLLLRNTWRLVRYFRTLKPDIVHAYLFTAYLFGIICARLAGVPTTIASRRSLGYFKDAKPWKQWIENMVNRWTDVVLVNSEAVNADVLARERIDPEKIELVYNGVDVDAFSAEEQVEKTRRELGLAPEALIVGCVANLIHYKGHKEIIEAARQVKGRYPQVRFLFVGRDGGMLETLKKQVAECGVEREVLFLGSRQDIPALLRLFDIQILASYEEGFSNVILEGMAAGKPIVATDVGGNGEAIVDGATGILIKPRDAAGLAEAIMRLLGDAQLRREMGEAGRARVRQLFSRERLIADMDRLYANAQCRMKSAK
jgi:glycosyltransferase involved in cell wall biosynthesis